MCFSIEPKLAVRVGSPWRLGLIVLLTTLTMVARASDPFGTGEGSFNGVECYSNGSVDYYSGISNYVNGYRTGVEYQCVEYVRRYYYVFYNMQMGSGQNADGFYDTAWGLTQAGNGGSTAPVPGAILCSKGPAGSNGHVAIIREVGSNYVKVIQQNWSNTSDDNAHYLSMNVNNGTYAIAAGGATGGYQWQGWLMPPVTAANVWWSGLPAAGSVWYRSDEHMVYHVGGSLPNTVHEMIDGNVTATYSTSDGYIALSYGPQGWHTYSVEAYNSANQNNPSTVSYQVGYDSTPPVAFWSSGALPQTWYQGYNQIEFGCTDNGQAGVKQCHYEWDNYGFTDWAPVNSATVPLLPGKHHLYVEVEDWAYTGSQALGNRATYDMGEYWLYTVAMKNFYTATNSVNGGFGTNGVVQFSGPADSGGDQVSIASSSADVQVPSSVTMPSGKTGISFQIQTSPVSVTEGVTLTANYGPFSLQTSLTLNPCPLRSFSLTNNIVNGGANSEGILQLAGKAGSAGAAISLYSGSPEVHVPSSVTIGSGLIGVTFPITTESGAIGGTTIVATYGSVRLNVFLTIEQGLGNFYTTPSTVKAGTPSHGVLQISHKAPAGGITVFLKSGSSDAVVPASITVPSGTTGVSFPIKTVKGGVGTVHLVATLGDSQKVAALTLTD